MAAYHRVDDLTVTCRLTACTPGSAPGPTLGIEYGKPLPFLYLFQDNLGKPVPEGKTILDFNEARDDGVAVALARPYANYLKLC